MKDQVVIPDPASAKPRALPRLSIGALAILIGLVVLILTPLPLVDKFYAIGFGICPQRPAHSYFLGETLLPGEAQLRAAIPALAVLAPTVATKLPVEARMYGIFAGFLVTWLYAFAVGRGRAALMPKPLIMFVLVAFIAFMGVDGINATIFDLHNAGLPIPYAYAPRLDIRFFTGWLCGLAMAGLVLPVVNYCLWRYAEPQYLFARLRDFIPLALIGIGIWLLIITGSGLLYYPVAVLAPVGILAILSALNVVLVLTLARRERVASNWNEALNPLAIALVFALLELGALSLMRWLAFGFGQVG